MPESEKEFEAHKELMHELISFPNFVTPDFEADMLKDTNDELNHEEPPVMSQKHLNFANEI